MAGFTQTSHVVASQRLVFVVAVMFAAVIGAVFSTETFVGFRQAPEIPRGSTLHATSGDGVVAIPTGDARPRKMKTQDELVYDTLGGIAAGGATAMMLIASAATTISMFKQATPAVPATAGRSVIVPLTTPAVVSITPPAQIVVSPASKVSVAPPAVKIGAPLMPKVAAAPASKVAKSPTTVVAPAVVTPMAAAPAVAAVPPVVTTAPIVALTPVAAPVVAQATPATAVVQRIESEVEAKGAPSASEQVAPTAMSRSARNADERNMMSFYGYSKTKSLYSALK